MSVDLIGYSERGAVNALCEDIYHSANPLSKLAEFLSWFDFSDVQPHLSVGAISRATILVEQGFSDFGDLDLLILVECHSGQRHSFFIEAKVSNDTNSWETVEDRWQEFRDLLNGAIESTSNLFVQLHRKVRLVAKLREGRHFVTDTLIPRGSCGTNQVVGRACQTLTEFLTKDGTAWFAAILPDKRESLISFARGHLNASTVPDNLPTWSSDAWGFLSWQVVAKQIATGNWPRTESTLRWNQGQIFRAAPPVRYSIDKKKVYLKDGQQVFVVDCRSQHCQVIELDAPDSGYFWKPTKVRVADLVPTENPDLLRDKPHLPKTGTRYIWDSRNEVPVFPNRGPKGGLPDGSVVIVVNRPSWVTTRVSLPNCASDTFQVFTHQLRRF